MEPELLCQVADLDLLFLESWFPVTGVFSSLPSSGLERGEREKKSSSQIPLLFYIPSLHVLPLLFQISGMTSPEELPNQPHMQREKQASRKTRALQKEVTDNLYFHYPFSCSFGVQANETQLFTAA